MKRPIRFGQIAACLLALVVGCAATAPNPAARGSSGNGAIADAGTGNGGAGAANGGAGAANGGAGAANGGAGASASAAGAGGSSGAGGATVDPAVASVLSGSCAKSTVQSALLPANILFVLDRSGSMACNPPPTTDSTACEQSPVRADASLPSKWEITTQALLAAIKTLPDTATIGISYFSNDDSCGVHPTPRVPLQANTQAQQSTIEASMTHITPAGGTPLVGATILAYQHMHQSALSGAIFGNEFVVLITDGQQSEECSDPTVCTTAKACTDYLINQEVPKASAPGVGIRTFVIGVPGSEPARTVLSTIAQKGGTGAAGCDPLKGNCHFDMTMEKDLGKALGAALLQIASQTISCELSVPQPDKGSLDLTLVNVVYTPGDGKAATLLLQDSAHPCDGGANGWQYTPDNTKIRLCGSICDTVRSDAGARVDVVLGCPVRTPQ